MQIYNNKINTELGLDMCAKGLYFFEVDDRNIYIRLYSNKLYNRNKIETKLR